MDHKMEKKQQKRRATSWLYIYRNNFLHSIIRPEQQPFQNKKVCVVIVLFLSLSLSFSNFELTSNVTTGASAQHGHHVC